jgi:outer membrane protein assembly factor BamB
MEIQLMNRKTLIVLVLTMVTLALTLPLVSASGWAQFHGNVKHTGYSTSNAPDTNHTAWRSDDIGAHSASSVTIADGRIFVYCWDYLVCLDEYTGAVLWNVSVENAKTNRTTLCGSWVTPTYHDGKVFLSAGRTYCFDATDGSNIWIFTAPTGVGAVDGSVAIAEGNVITSDWDGRHYYCLNKDDGTEIWNFTVEDDYAQSTPAISDGRAVFGSWTWGGGGHIYCVNMTTGLEEWTITTPDHPCGSATISEDVAYMTTYDFSTIQTNKGELYALNITNGSVIWSEPVERTDSTPAVAYGNVYVCGGCKGFSDLMTYCFNAMTGELLWNTSASDEIGNWKCSPAVADGKVFVGKPYFENSVMDYVGTYALDASTGEIVWSYQKGGSSPAVADGMVFTIGSERVYAFGSSIQDWAQFHYDTANTGNSPADAPDTNQVKWISENISAAEGSQAIIVGDQVFAYISVAGSDDAIYALNRATGSVEWSATFPGETEDWGSSTTPAYADGVVFVAAGYNVTGFDAATGTKLQEIAFPDGGYLSNGGVTVADGIVFVGSGSGANYYALDASDLNDVIWNYTITRSRAYSTPAVVNDRVIFGDAGWSYDDGYLYCVNEFTGDLVWSTGLTGRVWGSATIDAANNRVYVATAVDSINNEGKLYALTFDTGAVQWSADINYTSSTPAVSGEYIYVAASKTAPGVTHCFNSSGVEQWNVPTGSRKISPAVADGKLFTGNVGLSGMVSAGTEGINVYDATTGALIWQHDRAGSSPSIAEDADGSGIVVSIGADGMVYAFGGEGMTFDWTQFHYDVANTGNSPADAPETSHMKWISEDIGAVTGSQAMIAGDLVFVYANDTVYGISSETGTTIWNASIPGDTQVYGSWASPAYNDGVLFVSAGYNLTRINAETGTVLQQIAFPDGNIYSCNGGPTVIDGVVFVGSGLTPWEDDVARSHYYAFNENDLTDEKWNITNGAYESATSTPAVTANKVVFGNGSSLTCADETNGNIIWSTPLVGSVGGSAAIDAANDRVYVTTYVWGGQSTLYALDFANGVEDWNATIDYTSSTPAISGDYIYVSGGGGDKQGHTYCFNSAGVEQWNVSCGRWTMSPAIVDGKLFTGNSDPFTSDADGISAFNAISGALVWSYDHAGSSPAVAEYDNGKGIVVSIGNDGRVYAFSDIIGDVNHDGSVTTADAVIALQMAVGAVPPNGEADMNHDGAVTSLDALMIMQAAAGAIAI